MTMIAKVQSKKYAATDRLSCQGVFRFRDDEDVQLLTPVKPLIWLSALDEHADRFER